MRNSHSEKNRALWAWDIVKVVVGLSLVFYLILWMTQGLSETSNRIAIRASAKISFFLFCIAFSASALHFFIKNAFSYWLRMNRKYWGISFAISHFIHLVFLGLLQYCFHPVFNLAATTSLLAGGIAYLFIVLMFLTSFPTFAKYLSQQQWKWLHTIGGYWIWSIFMSSYWKRSMTEWEYVPYVVILLLVLGLRLAKWIKQYFN